MENNIQELVKNQREFFSSHQTLDINFRLNALKKLKQNIKLFEDEILDSLHKDLNKPKIEGFMCEISLCLKDIDYFLKNLKKITKPKKVKGTIENFPSKSYSFYEPYGVTLIMSPWNYPFLLTIQPLIESIAAGNTTILKVGNYSHHTSKTLKKLIDNTFDRNYVCLLEGDRMVNQEVIHQKFDYVFFTGSKAVGQIVMKAQSEFLTPLTLELGGKSPVIVDKTCDLELTAKRICFGKVINAGQTCVAPDYVLIDKSIKNDFISLFFKQINKQLGENPLENDDYGKIINQKHFERLMNLLDNQTILLGGKFDKNKLKIEPTLIEVKDLDNKIMQEEIFGPLLPIITFDNEEEIFSIINKNSTPLSLYYFGNNKKLQNRIISEIQFGGGCVNDTIMHLVSNLDFGGVGTSGMGSYHKFKGFETFSHKKNILFKKGHFDIDLRYRPYTEKKQKQIRTFLD
ncbi:MAG: aldehyde dehydrogenase [Clostridia bacterium]|nr:aldehyde dehydrogenase [Clostridia bacterium]